MRATFWLRVAGYLTWAVCGVPGVVDLLEGRMTAGAALAFGVAFVAFGAAFTACGDYSRWRLPPRFVRIALIAVQAISGLVMVWTTRDGLPAATLVIVAAQLPEVFSTATALAWVAAQSVAVAAIFWRAGGPIPAIVAGGAFAGFQLFAVTTAWLALSERLARQELARTNAELTAARELLAESSRAAERLRIARDLHDTMGHHLTALSLQLEVASRLAEGQAAQHVREAHALVRLLLGDVRDVVSRMRHRSRLDLADAVRALASAAEPMRIHLDMPGELVVDDSAQAHALLRCVQEIITNTARHAQAQNLYIRLTPGTSGIELHARDDGRGTPELQWGNGLKGMRERFEECAGRVEFRSTLGQGFEVRGFMPKPEALA